MSFLSVITKVGHVIKTGTDIASPFLSLIPGGSVLNTVLQVIFTAESVITQTGAGSLKKDAVMEMLHAALPNANFSRLSQAVDLIVAAVNLLSNVTADPPITAISNAAPLGSLLTSGLVNTPFVTGMTHDIQGNALPLGPVLVPPTGYTSPQIGYTATINT